MSESYSPLKDFASPQGGATCDTSPLSFNITNHIHHSVEFGQSTVMSPVTMSHFGDHKPEKLKKNEYQAKVKAPKKKGDRKKSAATLMVERDEILQHANKQLGDGNVRLLESNESHLALYGVCKEAVEKSQKQHKQAKSLQTNNMQAHKKIASLEKKLDAKDGTIRKLRYFMNNSKKSSNARKEFSRGHRHKRHEPSSSSNYSSDSLSDEYTPPRQKSRRRESKSDRREKKRRSRDESRTV